MEGNTNKPRLIMVFGAPCSGKTTFAKKMSDKFNIAYYDLNDIMRDLNIKHAELMKIMDLIARTGKNILIEGVIDKESERDALRHLFLKAGYAVSLIWIQTDTATIRTRMKARYQTVAKAKAEYEAAMNELEAPAATENPIILSGKHTFETQSKLVLVGLADADHR